MLPMTNKLLGFTLVEILITLVIVGLLTAIALPGYQSFIHDARRVDAQQYLLQQVATLEREYTRLGGYPDDNVIADTEYYQFSYSPSSVATSTTTEANDSTTFLLSASPISSQQSDKCGLLTINHQGSKTPVSSECWRN